MMQDPEELEVFYQEVIEDLPRFLPDGVSDVNLSMMQELGLLQDNAEEEEEKEDLLSNSFCVVETEDKLTLFNNKFVIWIVPTIDNEIPSTLSLIALNNKGERPHVEAGFSTSGIYNHSSLVLRILEKFLEEIDENEVELCKIKEKI